jgi:hypothetical protein
MRRWTNLSTWNLWGLIAGLGLTGTALAWSSFNLYQQAADNFRFIGAYGLMALMDGGLVQFLEILFFAIMSLCFYIAFRGFDAEIIDRWRGKKSD